MTRHPAAPRRRLTRSHLLVAALAAAAATTSACGTEEAPGPLQPSGPIGRVRFVNLITDPARNPVNASLEALPFGVGMGYTASTPATLPSPSTANYAAVLAGNRSLVVKRTADTSVTLATIGFTVAEGQDRTVYATGGTGGGAVTSFVTTDENPVPAAGQARLRVINLSPTAGATDVFVTAPNADLAAATPTVSALSYRDVSTYLTPAAGTYQIRFVPAGTAPANRAAAVTINLASVALASGAGRTVVAADRPQGGAPIQGFVLADR